MKSFKPILIVIVLLLLVGGGYFGYKTLKKTPAQQETGTTTETEQPETTEESSFSGTLKDLFTMGRNAKCTYSFSEEGTENSGVMYISGKNLRGDNTLKTADGTTMESSMILKDNTMYTWGSSMPYGLKLTVEEEMLDTDSEDSEEPTVPENIASFQKSLDYKCLPWIVDSSKFELPENVEFKDMSALIPTEESNNTPDMCAACDFIQEAEEKADCLATFNCE